MRVFQQRHRGGGDAVEADAAAAQLFQGGAHRLVAVEPFLAGGWRLAGSAGPAAALDVEPRHVERLHGLDQPVEIDCGVLPQLLDAAFGELIQFVAEQAQLQPSAGARGRHGVGAARRERVALPAEAARPDADRAGAGAGPRRDLLVGQRGVFDQLAHPGHGGIGVQPLAALGAAACHRRRAVFRRGWRYPQHGVGVENADARGEQGNEGIGHAHSLASRVGDADYMPSRDKCKPHTVVSGRERASASEPGTSTRDDEHVESPGSRSAGAARAPE